MPPYVGWALLGMAGYSLTTLFVKLATRDGQYDSFLVLGLAVSIVWTSIMTLVTTRGDWQGLRHGGWASGNLLWAIAAGVVLAIAVASLFRALSLGPASIVVPVYGMFIVGGAVLGMVFLGEPATPRKLAGIALAVVAVVLIAGGGRR